jgi:hypothetical protein
MAGCQCNYTENSLECNWGSQRWWIDRTRRLCLAILNEMCQLSMVGSKRRDGGGLTSKNKESPDEDGISARIVEVGV